jgi:hypothetical protein
MITDKQTKTESIAWCECGDSLETKKIMRKDAEYGEIIDHYEYYCFGCDKTYTLTEKKTLGDKTKCRQ